MQDYASQIRNLFEDDSFPPIVAFSGKWGIGKTYFTVKTLIPKLQALYVPKILYLSLLGISSLDDFKDLLVSKRYLEEKYDKKSTSKLFSILKPVTKLVDGKNIVSELIQNSTGAINHYLLNNISERVFVIDDLERLDDEKLQKDIIGECLRLTENKNKFLYVTDVEKLELDPSFTEKAFSETIPFNPTAEDIFLSLKPNLLKLAKDQNQIVTLIEENRLTNLRVLKRCFKRIESILSYLEQFPQIDYELTKSKIINDAIYISKKYYVDNNPEMIDGDDSYENTRLRINRSFILNDKFVSYMTGKQMDFKKVFHVDQLPNNGSPLDKILHNPIYTLNEEDFDLGVKALKKYILCKENVVVQKFFECTDYHDFLVKYEYIDKDERITIDKIDLIASSKKFSDNEGAISRQIHEKEYEHLLEKYLNQIYEDEKSQELARIVQEMKVSFKDSSLYTNHKYKTKPILHEIKIDTFIELIDGWKARDIGYFASFINGRYEFHHASAHLGVEEKVITELLEYLKTYQITLPKSPKRGNIRFVINALNKVLASFD
ncbi:hypothetical protein [Pseudoalteromonas lipolytica]|uniref:KAP NTPase domain-containing protein n=1 Tax=Pseudoalteromonas lipolytica TaxID=570156 RepID=A0ABU8SNQ2_9GAMM